MQSIDRLSDITNQSTFVAFVRALQSERADPKTRAEWQNDTIEEYLEAAVAWAEDAPMHLPQVYDEAVIWRTFAQFLYAGKIYE